jgi:hypothetical protein
VTFDPEVIETAAVSPLTLLTMFGAEMLAPNVAPLATKRLCVVMPALKMPSPVWVEVLLKVTP